MKRGIIIPAFLLMAVFAFANPFLGNWRVADDRYSFSDSHITGIMEGVNYESDYTYTEGTMTWYDRVWVYFFIDNDHFALLGFVGPNGAPMIWTFERMPSFNLGEGDKT
jgi:hypothetical protein